MKTKYLVERLNSRSNVRMHYISHIPHYIWFSKLRNFPTTTFIFPYQILYSTTIQYCSPTMILFHYYPILFPPSILYYSTIIQYYSPYIILFPTILYYFPTMLYYFPLYYIISPPCYIISHYIISHYIILFPHYVSMLPPFLCHVLPQPHRWHSQLFDVKVITRIVITHFPPQQATGESKKYIM